MAPKVGFLVSPVSLNVIRNNLFKVYPFTRLISKVICRSSDMMLKRLYSSLPPHLFRAVKGLKSPLSSPLDLEIYMLPLFPSQLLLMPPERAVGFVSEAVKLAAKRGCSLIGLGGFTSIVGDQGLAVAELLKGRVAISITSGNTLTAWLAAEEILSTCKRLGRETSSLSFLVVGATGDIGSAVSRWLGDKFKIMHLSSRSISSDSLICSDFKKRGVNFKVASRITPELLKSVDVIFLATSSLNELIDSSMLNEDTLVFDVSVPSNFKMVGSKHVYAAEVGRAKFEQFDQFVRSGVDFLFENSLIYGCLAETLVLGFEGRFENYSIGRGEISISRMADIASLSVKHNIVPSSNILGG